MDVTALLVELVSRRLESRPRVAVAIDGPDAAGKTTFADALVGSFPVPALRASVDGFHRPRAARLLRGELSPDGYYLDSFDYSTMERDLLLPFASGDAWIRTRTYDHRRESPVDDGRQHVARSAVLLVDGVFLLRPELRARWDVSVHLHVSPEETIRRAVLRDLELFGSEEVVRRRYTRRYLPGQDLYRADANPWAYTDLLVDNTVPAAPVLLRPSRP